MPKSRNRYTGRYSSYQRRAKINYHPDYRQYARLKFEWEAANPGSTPEAHQEAMRAIAAKCGI